MVGRIAGITKMSDCERTLRQLAKDNRKTGHVGGEGRDLSTAGDDETIPDWRTFCFLWFHFIYKLTNNRHAEQGNKMTLLCAWGESNSATNGSRDDV